MNTIELTDILEAVLPKELLDALNNGETVTIEPPKPKQWEPKGGAYFMNKSNKCGGGISFQKDAIAGRERATEALGRAAAKASRSRDRLECFRDEKWPGEKGIWGISGSNGEWKAVSFGNTYPGLVKGPKEFAEEAARLLNSGELVL